MTWTEEDISKVRQLADEGLSSAQIASHFINVSRNAVLGVCKRHNIILKVKSFNRHTGIRIIVKDKSIKFKSHKEQVMIAESYIPPVHQRKTLLELKSTSCRWPLGNGPDYFFCGGDSLDGKPYCENHCIIAYNRKQESYDPKKKSLGSL